jgi:NADPH:quinone reductase-like Zn-dependent oxidoreductase
LLGTGGVSIYALQIAKAMGAYVAITSSSDEKLEKAKALGADFIVNYKAEPEWGSAVNAWSGEKGVDHVVEVGGPATLAQSINACRVNGNIVLIGVLTGVKGDVPTAALMAKQINLKGIIVGSREHQNDFVNALEASGIKPVIETSFSLDELAKAFEYEVNGKHFGKICIDI